MSDSAPSYQTRLSFATVHPALAGHFPGSPIVPGVVLLDTVLTCAEAWLGYALQPTGVPSVKFLSSLRPEEEVVVSLWLTTARLAFTINAGDAAIAQGAFSLAPAEVPQ